MQKNNAVESLSYNTGRTTLVKHTMYSLTGYLLSSRHLRSSPVNDCSKASTAAFHGTGMAKVEIKRVFF